MQIISSQCQKHGQDKYRIMGQTSRNQYLTLNQEEQDIVFEDQDFQDKNYRPSFFLQFFFAFLYFLQGIIIALSATMPYIYPQLPSYDVMAVFSASLLPYSFKFLIAPFIQKYSFFIYGKRKFWIVVSQILTSICILASSFFTQFDQSYTMAYLLLVSNFFITIQDISLDSLAKKQLRLAHVVSMISATSQITGIILGSMLLLKLTSLEFAQSIYLSEPITTIPFLVKIFGFLILAPSILIHFIFKETILKRQFQARLKPIGQIIYSYRAFFNIKGKYFRTILLFLFWNQGFNFFIAGYDYELVTAGFSRDTNNTINNVIVIPVNILVCFATSKIQPFGIKKGLIISMLAQIIIFSYLRIFFPLNVYSIVITNFLSSVFSIWVGMILSIFIYQFPLHRYSGMFITFLASCSNLGSNLTLHTKILALSNWWLMSWIGLGLQLIIALFVNFYYLDWKDEGLVDLDQIFEDSDQMKMQNKKKSQNENENQFQIQFQKPLEITETKKG